MEAPEAYGFHLGRSDVYTPLTCQEVVVDTAVSNLASFALATGTTLRELKAINPWLRGTQLDVAEGKSYAICVPL